MDTISMSVRVHKETRKQIKALEIETHRRTGSLIEWLVDEKYKQLHPESLLRPLPMAEPKEETAG